MLRWWAAGSVALVLLAAPAVQACADATPQLALEFKHPDGCKRGFPQTCPALPEADAPFVLDGELVWSWTPDACATMVPSADPVHISFASVERSNHGWLMVTTEPREIFIPVQEQWDVTDDQVDPASGSYRNEQRYPLQIVVSLVGEPSPEALASLETTGGVATVFLKATADPTATFAESFGIEPVSFDARPAIADSSSTSNPVPGPAAVLLGLALLAAALVQRRPE